MGKIIGIDYSLNSPAVSVLNADNPTFQNSQHYFLTNTKKYVGHWDNITGSLHKVYTSEMQRYEQIAKWVMDIAFPQFDDTVIIEDYSMGSTGRVFNIAENCGILKYLLYLRNIKYITVPPTVIKKSFCLKGNGSKEQMYEAFVSKTKIDLMKIVGATGKLSNPVTDIVDSFAIGLYSHDSFRFK